jgi:uncharacterized protein (TIGR02145 family)
MKDFKRSIYRIASEDSCPNCVAQNIPIGTQVWTRCNATVSTYRNGNSIPYVDNQFIWNSLTTGAWCYYNNDPSTEATYGKLYNWYAVNDPRGIAPTGWKVPTDAEWTVLTDYLGGVTVAGGKMKEVGLCHWTTPNTSATNTSLFTGLPGGTRNDNGNYGNIGLNGYWWSSTEYNTNNAWSRSLNFSIGLAGTGFASKETGYSLRFIEETCQDCVAHDVPTIGTQVWAGCNVTVSTYRDNTLIPYVDNPTTWAALTTGAWCWYNNDPANEATYGKLYNWYAVAGIYDAASLSNPSLRKQFAPTGYHVSSQAEWTALSTFLVDNVAGGKLKEAGYCHWASPNTGATNSTGFSALPGGVREFIDGSFNSIGTDGSFWTSTENNDATAYSRYMYFNMAYIGQNQSTGKKTGLSVRLVKD